MDQAQLLAAYDNQVRRGLVGDGSGARIETDGPVVRWVAVAGGDPVSSARIDFPPGTEFAGLYGGGTVPAWRGRGIYRALVAYRARLAAERGYRYLSVDASADSEPILRRLGFRVLAQTTPYHWTG